MSAIDKANDIGNSKKSRRMKIYEAFDPEPEEDDEETEDMSSYYDNDFDDIDDDFGEDDE